MRRPKKRLKTGTDELKLEKNRGRAEFYVLPIGPPDRFRRLIMPHQGQASEKRRHFG
jgi:hypothetical protein